MDIRKLVGAVAATVITFGIGAATVPSASAADNIKIFGEEETLNGFNSQPYIGYTVYGLGPSSDAVPHNGQLYSAKLRINGYGMNTDPMIGRFGARALKGTYYPAIADASNGGRLYFDVTGPVPNSVVWNDGVRDILAWIPGEIPLGSETLPGEPAEPAPPPPPPYDPFATAEGALTPSQPGAMPAESNGNLGEATPDIVAPAPFQLNEAEVASPGFNR